MKTPITKKFVKIKVSEKPTPPKSTNGAKMNC